MRFCIRLLSSGSEISVQSSSFGIVLLFGEEADLSLVFGLSERSERLFRGDILFSVLLLFLWGAEVDDLIAVRFLALASLRRGLGFRRVRRSVLVPGTLPRLGVEMNKLASGEAICDGVRPGSLRDCRLKGNGSAPNEDMGNRRLYIRFENGMVGRQISRIYSDFSLITPRGPLPSSQ